MNKHDEFLSARNDTISNDLLQVYAGSEDFDEAAVRVAEYLDSLTLIIGKWAETPGNHGGNPYRHRFVTHALEVYHPGDRHPDT